MPSRPFPPATSQRTPCKKSIPMLCALLILAPLPGAARAAVDAPNRRKVSNMTVTKAGLANHLYDSRGLSKRGLHPAWDALELVDRFFVTMRQTLARGESVLLSGFGRFTLREKRSRCTVLPSWTQLSDGRICPGCSAPGGDLLGRPGSAQTR
jgi:nucleoid DNA-binding protein